MVKLQKSTQMQAECVEKMHIPLRLQHHLPPKPPQIVLQSTKPNAIPCRHAHKKTSQNLRHFIEYFVASADSYNEKKSQAMLPATVSE